MIYDLMNGHLELITNRTGELVAATGIGSAILMAQVASYGQTIITVSGEILIACITGYCLVKVGQLKTHINSRMDELLKLTANAARAEGMIEGKTKEQADVALVAKGAAAATAAVVK
jgi:hypothetical protein